MACSGRNPAAQCEFTTAYQGGRPYQNPSGLACDFPYQMLPGSLLAVRNPLVILDWSTNAYQSADLGRNPGQNTITNHYHRGGGQGIDVSVDQTDRMGHTVKGGWVVQGYNCIEQWHTVAHTGEPYGIVRRLQTRWSVSKRFFFFQKGRSACILNPMVVKLVWQ